MVKKSKSLIFISHISEEQVIGHALKSFIEHEFRSMVSVFVSSIPLGTEWFDQIKEALKTCDFAIVLASPKSVSRPWVNFESGAVWARGKSVIPLCHSGMTKSKLPSPLTHLQGAEINPKDLQEICDKISDLLNADRRTAQFDEFIKTVKSFELNAPAVTQALPKPERVQGVNLEIDSVAFAAVKVIAEVPSNIQDGRYVRNEAVNMSSPFLVSQITGEIVVTVLNASTEIATNWGVKFTHNSQVVDRTRTLIWKKTDGKSLHQGFLRPDNLQPIFGQEAVEVRLSVTAEIASLHSNDHRDEIAARLHELSFTFTPTAESFIGQDFVWGFGKSTLEDDELFAGIADEISQKGYKLLR